jgi:heterodisulfide reductase subunit C
VRHFFTQTKCPSNNNIRYVLKSCRAMALVKAIQSMAKLKSLRRALM